MFDISERGMEEGHEGESETREKTVAELQEELDAVRRQLEEMRRTVSNADELLSMMVEERDAVNERITKLQTLRKTRPSKSQM